ncbi:MULTISPECIES: GFA family protein [Marinobacter]|uniref:GFA family protein n=1 Tax=Marinobacter suaedae TaxID=3057675 RepID=A0ABT8W1V6_9GAMM|nr:MULTISPECIES: GFA family protein [unclassified Marinobacter]MBZ2168033.1 GFA family protein [Marinobacter sp. F4216]MDO3722222.1 GFA family protein [Marinobacter sp. chi1]
MEREARCLCGSLTIWVSGNPSFSIACNCINCQRRTGSSFGTLAYFKDDQVLEQKGEFKKFQFQSDSGRTNTTHFCPECGSTVFFKAEAFKGMTGVAAGCFPSPDIPEPTMAVWTRSKHSWVEFPEHWTSMEQQTP